MYYPFKIETLNYRALIFCSYNLYTDSFTSLLKEFNYFKEIISCKNLEDIKPIVATRNISHVFIDLSSQSNAIISFVKSIADLNKRLYILTIGSSENYDLIYKIKEAGACAFISKESGKNEIENCIQTIQNENYYINADVFNIVMSSNLDEQNKRTDMEQQVLLQIASGKSTRQISSMLKLSQQTIINYRRNIMIKLSVNNRQELLERLNDLQL